MYVVPLADQYNLVITFILVFNMTFLSIVNPLKKLEDKKTQSPLSS